MSSGNFKHVLFTQVYQGSLQASVTSAAGNDKALFRPALDGFYLRVFRFIAEKPKSFFLTLAFRFYSGSSPNLRDVY
jgi:hypothetical protein